MNILLRWLIVLLLAAAGVFFIVPGIYYIGWGGDFWSGGSCISMGLLCFLGSIEVFSKR